MQMGRWFGYRPGYVDLCRLFTSRELNEWFCHISLASEELREEFDYMSDIAGSTPEQYALRVRTHPGVLQISASNKIRRATQVRVSWSGRLVETYELDKAEEIIKKNFSSADTLVNRLGDGFVKESNYFLWKDKPFELIKEFLAGFQVFDNLKSASPSNLLKFIEYKYRNRELSSWNIGVITKKQGSPIKIGGCIDVNLIDRSQSSELNDDLYYLRKSHIISPDDEFIDLSDEEKIQAKEATSQIWKRKGKEGEPTRINGEWVRNNIRKPDRVLLLIYLLDPVRAELPASFKPIVGFAISFPGTNRDDAVAYAVHDQLLSKFTQDDLTEEFTEDEED